MQQPQEQHMNRSKFQQQPGRSNFGRNSSMGNDGRQEQQRFSNRQENGNFGQQSQGGRGSQQSSQQHVARNPFQSQQEQQQQHNSNFPGQSANMGYSTGHQTSNMNMNMDMNMNMNMNSSHDGGHQQNNQFSGYDSSRINTQRQPQFPSSSPGLSGRFQSDQGGGWNSSGKPNAFQQQQQHQGQGHGQTQPQFHQLSSDSLREVDASAAIAGAITADFSLGLPVSSSSTFPGVGGATANTNQGSGAVDNAVSSSASVLETAVVNSVFSLLSEIPPAYNPYEENDPFRAGFIPHIPPPAATFNPSPFSQGLGFGVPIR